MKGPSVWFFSGKTKVSQTWTQKRWFFGFLVFGVVAAYYVCQMKFAYKQGLCL